MNVREDLKAFVDDELAAARRTEVQEALDRDEALRGKMEFMRLLGGEIREAAIQPETVGLEKTLKSLEVAAKKPGFPKFPVMRLFVTTAVCAVLAVFLYPIVARSHGSDDDADPKVAFSSERSVSSNGSFGPGVDPTLPQHKIGQANGDNLTNGVPDTTGRGGDELKARQGGAGGSRFQTNTPAPKPDRDGTVADVPTLAPVPAGTIPLQRPLMVRTGELTLIVDDVQKAEQDATHFVEAMGGIVQSTNRTAVEGQPGAADMTVRVPETRFMPAMEALSKLGTVKTQSSNGEDVTTQVADTEARLRVMRAEEDQYVGIMHNAHHIEDILAVKERLSDVREQIESLDAQRKALRSQSSYSTISLSMSEKPKTPVKPTPKPVATNWGDDTLKSAKDVLSSVGQFLGQTAIYLGVLSPLWVPICLVALWMRKRSGR